MSQDSRRNTGERVIHFNVILPVALRRHFISRALADLADYPQLFYVTSYNNVWLFDVCVKETVRSLGAAFISFIIYVTLWIGQIFRALKVSNNFKCMSRLASKSISVTHLEWFAGYMLDIARHAFVNEHVGSLLRASACHGRVSMALSLSKYQSPSTLHRRNYYKVHLFVVFHM